MRPFLLHLKMLSCYESPSKHVVVRSRSLLLVRKADAKGSVSGCEIAPPSKGGGSDKQLAVN